MKSVTRFPILWLAVLLFSSCRNDPSALKPVQEQRAGDYTVTLLTETASMKQGASDYTLEFRNTAEGQLADVGSVEVAPVMEMPGMGPMMGSAEVSTTGTAGRYVVHQTLSMGGLWKIDVKFGDNQKVRFSLSAE